MSMIAFYSSNNRNWKHTDDDKELGLVQVEQLDLYINNMLEMKTKVVMGYHSESSSWIAYLYSSRRPDVIVYKWTDEKTGWLRWRVTHDLFRCKGMRIRLGEWVDTAELPKGRINEEYARICLIK